MKGFEFLEEEWQGVCGFETALPSPVLNEQQQLVLISLVRGEDPVAKQQLIIHNLRLVVNMAKRYSASGIELFELVKEGIEGFIHALKHFEQDGGFRFAGYAAWCVRKYIECAVFNRNKQCDALNSLTFAIG